MAQSASNPLNKVILGFSTKANAEAEKLIDAAEDVHYIHGPIIYHILEQYEEWRDSTQSKLEAEQRENLVYPGKLLYLENHTFRQKNPAIIGVRVLGGRVHVGQKLMKLDGTQVGQIRSLRTRDSDDVKEARQGDEVALALHGPTVGRQINELDEFFVDIPERHASRLRKIDLTPQEEEILEEITKLHRKSDHYWGR